MSNPWRAITTRKLRILLPWLLLLAPAGRAQTAGDGSRPDPRQSPGSGLLLRALGSSEPYRAAPELATSFRLSIVGPIVRASVDQRFVNPDSVAVEAVYLFPLPEDAAIDTLELVAGGQRIVGEVRERERAKQEYEAAKTEGKRAALLEQHRPNLFTLAVAGIAAGEEVTVHVEFQQLARYDAGSFRLRLPLVVGPRFEPPADSPPVESSNGSSPPPDAPAPVVAMQAGIARPVEFVAVLDAGAPLARVESSTHRLLLRKVAAHRLEIRLATGEVAADRELELAWTPEAGSAPQLARFEEETGSDRYVALLFLPPAPETPAVATPRDLVVVLDTSGSMGGTSIQQAKRAVQLALARLQPWDRFNVIRFSDGAERLFPESVDASAGAIEEATAWVQRLAAEGGTNVASALDLALSSGATPGLLRQILFVTDGCVGNETALFDRLAARLGENRLFTVGIGSAPNSYFMTRAAEIGRGTYTFVSRIEEVEARMNALFVKLERPALVDLELAWDDPVAESYPAKLPDLYSGEPILVVARLARGDAAATISGQRGGEPFRATVAAGSPVSAAGIARLWARRKLDALDAARREPGADLESLRTEAVALAIEHRLLSRDTSFVAVAEVASRDASTPLARRDVATLRPAGWTLGDLPQGGTRAPLELLAALALALAALALGRFGGGK